jgi:hypothetical protein
VSADEAHPAVAPPPAEAAGEAAGDAGAELAAAAPPDGAELAPPEAEFPLTGPQAAVSAAVASRVAVPRRRRVADVIGSLL